jgi:hypothetical protein
MRPTAFARSAVSRLRRCIVGDGSQGLEVRVSLDLLAALA